MRRPKAVFKKKKIWAVVNWAAKNIYIIYHHLGALVIFD